MIDRVKFAACISKIKEVEDYHTALNNFFDKHGVDGSLYTPDNNTLVISLLSEMMGDTQDLIGTFCYALNFGKDKDAKEFTLEDGTKVNISSTDKLYDVLMAE